MLTVFDGSLTFDTDILGVIMTNHQATGPGNHRPRLLEISDAVLGNPGTTYPPLGFSERQLELGQGSESDRVTLSADRRTLTFHMVVQPTNDQLRILTAPSSNSAVPEPSSFAMVGLMLAVGAAVRRSRLATSRKCGF